MEKNNKIPFSILCGTILTLFLGYLIRFKEPVYMFFYNNLTTYPGDLWNFFTNYLAKGLHYPPEYPAGLRFFYELFRFYKYATYTSFFTINALILGIFALATTYILYILLRNKAEASGNVCDVSNLWYFWILSPSFIFYGFLNYDLPIVFLIVLAIYLFSVQRYNLAVLSLAVGTVIKVFPIFLLPVFIWRAPTRLRIRLIFIFFTTIILLNLPYAITDFQTWIHPYVWQISSNLSTGPDQGTYWWLIYPLVGKFTGWLSLMLFGGLYLWAIVRLKKFQFFDLCMVIIILFLLTDRVYSPQYTIYLLPFLILATYPINKRLFYFIEIPNLFVVLFCFFLKANPIYLQIIVVIRYSALIVLLISYIKQNNVNSLHVSNGSSK